jgi:hypothetical protein
MEGTRGNPNSDLNRENYFLQEYDEIVIIEKFPKTGHSKYQNHGFSTPQSREKNSVLIL